MTTKVKGYKIELGADLQRAAELIAGGGCRPRAIELLEGVERRGGLEPPGAGGDESPNLLLARAHLGCEHLALAEVYLRRVRREQARESSEATPERGPRDASAAEAHRIRARKLNVEGWMHG